MATPDQWLTKLTRLRIDRASGDPAPHKPLLLLSILELAQAGELPMRQLPLSPELAFRFFGYWSVVTERRKQKPDIRLPFHFLKSDGFWTVFEEYGKPSPHYRQTMLAEMASDFVACALDPVWRDKARRILVGAYFLPKEQLALFELMGIPVPNQEVLRHEISSAARTEAELQGREARFRINVVSAYNYTCALTSYRLTTITGSIVDAAHIHEFAKSRNNDPRNGLALCKNAHWLFDQGLWTLTDQYRVIVAVGRFAEDSPNQKALLEFNGKLIHLPRDKSLWPSLVHIGWHRKHMFQSP
jgi:putative restriction endonuclease